GTLFRGRYKSILVDGDSYVLQLVRYIHLNPLKAGVVTRPGQYAWSSHKGYLSRARKWNWLYRDLVLKINVKGSNLRLTLSAALGMNPQWLDIKIEWQKVMRERMKKYNRFKILGESK
ncbi:MAG: hypothetical protein ABIL06_18150, partial [Pseudomonadota bacterium]